MKDRAGYEYSELLGVQREHLECWKERLKPAIFSAVREYVLAVNRESRLVEEKHRVYRGQDLVEIIRLWPELGPAFEPKPVVAASAQDLI